MKAQLRFPIVQLTLWANQYDYPLSDDSLSNSSSRIRKRGCLTKNELYRLARWKSPRSAGHILLNDDAFVRDVTRYALNTRCERSRIESLIILDGISWATASVILHFYHRHPYPILDFRALWSVSLDVPSQYHFDLWRIYFDYCRRIAAEARVSMRMLDRALWQYSKVHQPKQ